jgi:hypothetical protein
MISPARQSRAPSMPPTTMPGPKIPPDPLDPMLSEVADHLRERDREEQGGRLRQQALAGHRQLHPAIAGVEHLRDGQSQEAHPQTHRSPASARAGCATGGSRPSLRRRPARRARRRRRSPSRRGATSSTGASSRTRPRPRRACGAGAVQTGDGCAPRCDGLSNHSLTSNCSPAPRVSGLGRSTPMRSWARRRGPRTAPVNVPAGAGSPARSLPRAAWRRARGSRRSSRPPAAGSPR